jgi:WhiB family transcriptional regulator, redox-sensing transcriptional regulator
MVAPERLNVAPVATATTIEEYRVAQAETAAARRAAWAAAEEREIEIQKQTLELRDILGSFVVREAWQSKAACRGIDPNLFFPIKPEEESAAKDICKDCTVREECLDSALAGREKGIWGGMTEKERNKLQRSKA